MVEKPVLLVHLFRGAAAIQSPEVQPAGVKKVSEPGNLVARNFFELRVLQKIFQKIFQHFEITLFTELTSYNYSTLFTSVPSANISTLLNI
jgi:hypothetical protein